MEKSIHFWSDSKYVPLLAIPPTFMEMDTSSKNAGTFKDLRTASKVVCDVNSLCRHIQVKFVVNSFLNLIYCVSYHISTYNSE